MKKLSIVIPAYNAEPEIHELLDRLNPQITDEVEVVVVDDGSLNPFKTDYPWVRVIRQENKGLSAARNIGIKNTTGEYIAFIDADDLVSENYVSLILAKIPFDYLEMSWKSFGGAFYHCKLNSDDDKLTNPAAWARVNSRAFIGELRFNENKDAAEDEDFARRMNYYSRDAVRKAITDYVYFYRTSNSNSLFNKYINGLCNTKKIIYYYNIITADMNYLVDEIKYEDQYNEVIILTNRCDIPELYKYAQIYRPQRFRGHEKRGELNNYIEIIQTPVKAQLVIFTHRTFEIGGIETFTHNFCMSLKDYYDITVLYDEMNIRQIDRIAPYVKVIKNNPNKIVYCDVLIINRIIDTVPNNIKYNRIIQMVHTCRHIPSYHIPQGRDTVICVSEACKNSFGIEGKDSIVLKNLIPKNEQKESLFLISATRLDTNEKGQKRMLKLANEFEKHGIPYIWLYFSNCKLDNAPKGMICVEPTMDIRSIIARADFLVQLSDTESFCFSIVESLIEHTPVICTDLEVLPEIGVVDGVNAHVLPMDINAEYDVEKIYNNRLTDFKYEYDNDALIKEWKKVLGQLPNKQMLIKNNAPKVKVMALRDYTDIVLNADIKSGTTLYMLPSRAYYLQNVKKFVRVLGE